MAGAQLLAAGVEHPVVLLQEPQEHELLKGGVAEVVRRAGEGETRDGGALGADPAEADAAPHALADGADRDDGAVHAERRGRIGVEAEVAHGLVGDDRRAMALGEGDDPRALGRGHRARRGVVEVGHEVRERGGCAGEDLLEGLVVPAALCRDGHGHESGADLLEGFECVRRPRRV